MKRLLPIVLFALFYSNSSEAQTSFTTEEISVLNKFGISESDHRGVIFYTTEKLNCSQTTETSKDAIELFFNSKVMSDLTEICITNDSSFEKYSGKILDIKSVAALYLELLKRESEK